MGNWKCDCLSINKICEVVICLGFPSVPTRLVFASLRPIALGQLLLSTEYRRVYIHLAGVQFGGGLWLPDHCHFQTMACVPAKIRIKSRKNAQIMLNNLEWSPSTRIPQPHKKLPSTQPIPIPKHRVAALNDIVAKKWGGNVIFCAEKSCECGGPDLVERAAGRGKIRPSRQAATPFPTTRYHDSSVP